MLHVLKEHIGFGLLIGIVAAIIGYIFYRYDSSLGGWLKI